MNSFQIKCFLTTVIHMNFSRAAQELFISQPAISRHIVNLERELGVKLFERGGKTISLTDSGKAYYDFFIKAEKEYLLLQQQNVDSVSKHIRYSVFPVWNISEFMQKNTERMQSIYPSLQINLEFRNNLDFLTELQNDTIDAVFHMCTVLQAAKGIEYAVLTEIPNIILYSVNHRLARRKDLTPQNFKDETFIYLLDENVSAAAIHRIFYQFFLKYGFHPRTQEAPDLDTMMFMVENGRVVTLMDSWCRNRYYPNLLHITTDINNQIGLAWRQTNRNPALKLFVNETINFFKDQLLP